MFGLPFFFFRARYPMGGCFEIRKEGWTDAGVKYGEGIYDTYEYELMDNPVGTL